MIKQRFRLPVAAVLGIASMWVALASPRLTSVTPDDLARFANGERVAVRYYSQNKPLSVGLGVAAVALLATWAWYEMAYGQVPLQVTQASNTAEPQLYIKPPDGVEPPESYIDITEVLAQRLRPTLITGNPRIGKGIVVANAIRRIKQKRPDVTVWLIQPKYHPKEHAYWEPCDRVYGFMLEDYAGDEDGAEEHIKNMTQFIREWRKQEQRPTVLIFDELSLAKGILPKWYKSFVESQLITEMSAGETDERGLWAITQSPLAQDVGLSGGNRAPFDLLAIEAPKTQEHLASLCRSYQGVPKPESDLVYEQSLSPKNAIFYHSACDEWLPMLRYRVPEKRKSISAPTSAPGSRGSQYQKGNTEVVRNPTSATSRLPEGVDLSILISVSQAEARGLTSTQIIEDILGFKGRKYEEGKELYDKIKAIIEEFS